MITPQFSSVYLSYDATARERNSLAHGVSADDAAVLPRDCRGRVARIGQFQNI